MLKTLFGGICIAAMLGAAGLDSRDTRLADAAMNGDKAAVRSLLSQKVNVNAPQGDGTTALHWAAFKDDLEMVKMLLAAGADVKAVTREGAITPLFMACNNGDAPMIEAMLKAGADPKSVKANGTTALMMASAAGNADAVKVLVDHGADVNAKEAMYGQTALMFAAAQGRSAAIKVLLAHGADANIATNFKKLERVRFDQDGNIVEDRPARGAAGAVSGPAEQLNELAIAMGFTSADYKVDMIPGLQSDMDAFAHGIGRKSAELTLAKPKARAGDIGFRGPRKVGPDFLGAMNALLYAAREGHMEAVQALVEGGVDVNKVNSTKFTPILEAVINGHLDVAKYLLEHGADPNLANESGLTPLYATIDVQWAPKAWYPEPSTEQEKTKYLDLMKELLEHGANVNAQVSEKLWFRSFTNDYTWVDPGGATALWRAAQSSDLPAMHLLVEHGADPKIASKAGDTPLLAAAGIGWAWNWTQRAPYPAVDAVKYLVELGNDVNAADRLGYTPLHGAAYLGDNDMINFLVSKGAKVDAKSKAGDTVADMANGPTRFGQPHAETVALLEKLGSANSHNCRSDQCVVASRAAVYQMTAADLDAKELLDKFAVSIGLTEVDYKPDVPARGFPGGGN